MEIDKPQPGEALDQEDLIEDFLEGRKDFDVNDKNDKYRLMNAKDLTEGQKIAHFRSPDYCIVTRADTLYMMLSQLLPLVSRGGVYYSIYDQIQKPDDFNKTTRDRDLIIIVLFFDDSVIDLMGEILKVNCRLSSYDCVLPFRCYAGDLFDQFNARQVQSIVI